ncbi:MAG: hypothetical protein AAFQ53_02040 [Bacteroidota bacterium]
MQPRRLSPLLIALLVVFPLLGARCGSDSDDDASPNPTASEDRFVEACLDALNWDEALCTCADDLARAELTDTAYDFVVATLQDNEAETARIRPELSFEEATSAGLFMVRAGSECGRAEAPEVTTDAAES